MKNVVYLTNSCPYCQMAKRLLDKKGVKYQIMDAQSADIWKEMQEKTGRNTVPQIYINDYHVGGFDDLSLLEKSGKLDRLIDNLE